MPEGAFPEKRFRFQFFSEPYVIVPTRMSQKIFPNEVFATLGIFFSSSEHGTSACWGFSGKVISFIVFSTHGGTVPTSTRQKIFPNEVFATGNFFRVWSTV